MLQLDVIIRYNLMLSYIKIQEQDSFLMFLCVDITLLLSMATQTELVHTLKIL